MNEEILGLSENSSFTIFEDIWIHFDEPRPPNLLLPAACL